MEIQGRIHSETLKHICFIFLSFFYSFLFSCPFQNHSTDFASESHICIIMHKMNESLIIPCSHAILHLLYLKGIWLCVCKHSVIRPFHCASVFDIKSTTPRHHATWLTVCWSRFAILSTLLFFFPAAFLPCNIFVVPLLYASARFRFHPKPWIKKREKEYGSQTSDASPHLITPCTLGWNCM